MTEPTDDTYGPGPAPDGAVLIVRCDGHRRGGRFLFEHLTGGGWRPRRVLDQDDVANRDQRAVGGLIETASGWRLACPTCGQDGRFDRGRLAAVLDAFATAGVDRISLDTLTEAYKRI